MTEKLASLCITFRELHYTSEVVFRTWYTKLFPLNLTLAPI
jgi:hypothetical protein